MAVCQSEVMSKWGSRCCLVGLLDMQAVNAALMDGCGDTEVANQIKVLAP